MNRCRGWIAICVFALGCAAGAAAQNDVMCLCTDDGSASTCGGNVDVAAFAQVTLYFGVLGPSGSQVAAWEAYLEIEGEGNLAGSWTVLGTNPLNFGSGTEFLVGIGANPIQPNSANMIPLLSYSGTLLDEVPIKFFIRPVPNSQSFPDLPGYAPEAGVPILCTPCGFEGQPSFTINSAAEDEAKAWGEVKSLYD
ncbi:hypothetical protein H8E07_12160 [bacterium]|nr:hypothetical protein [bacterium]